MDIDFSKKEEREGYLQTKLDDLLDGINASYGQSLLDELMIRLEATIDDFNKEVDDLMDSLKKSSDEKEKLLQQIRMYRCHDSALLKSTRPNPGNDFLRTIQLDQFSVSRGLK